MSCYIERIEIVSFGKLKNTVLKPSEGINLLSAPNESGKSTLAAFLRFVLYGFADSRKKDLSENDKKLYTPWDNPRCEGSLTLSVDGKRYLVERSYLGTGKETVTVTEKATGKEVFGGKEPGVALLGVSEEVFSRTLFFKQLTLPQGKDDVLAEQLQNIAVSADEQVGSKRALERLTKAKNELKGRAAGGWIPKLEQDAARLELLLGEAGKERASLEELRSSQKALEDKLKLNAIDAKKVENEKTNAEKWDALQRLERIKRFYRESEQAKQAYETAKAQSPSSDETDERRLNGVLLLHSEWKASSERASRAEEAYQAFVSSEPTPVPTVPEKGKTPILPLVLMACGLLIALVAVFTVRPLISVGGVTLLAGVILLALHLKKQNLSRAEREREEERSRASRREKEQALLSVFESEQAHEKELLARLQSEADASGVTLTDDLALQLEERLRTFRETERLRLAYENASRAFAVAGEGVDLNALSEQASGAVKPERDPALIERDREFLRQQNEMLSKRSADTRTEIARLEGGMKDLALLAGKKDSVERRLEECKKRYAAYEIARACIEEASDRMKATVAPRLGEIAGNYVATATNGKYEGVRLDTKLSMTVTENGMERDNDFLSAGTRDVTYLSLRLALCDMLFENRGAFFLLDDALTRMDDERLSAMMRVLAQAGNKHQILLFTCTDREETALRKEQIPYHEVSL